MGKSAKLGSHCSYCTSCLEPPPFVFVFVSVAAFRSQQSECEVGEIPEQGEAASDSGEARVSEWTDSSERRRCPCTSNADEAEEGAGVVER